MAVTFWLLFAQLITCLARQVSQLYLAEKILVKQDFEYKLVLHRFNLRSGLPKQGSILLSF